MFPHARRRWQAAGPLRVRFIAGAMSFPKTRIAAGEIVDRLIPFAVRIFGNPMKPPPLDYAVPDTLDEALAILAEHQWDAQPIAGGQSLLPLLALRVARPGLVVDLQRIEELKGITVEGGALRIGAMTRQVEVLNNPLVKEHLPALADAMALVGHYQTRNRGTLGGSISLGEPAAENPAFALALDAELELQSANGTRIVPASEFYTGPYMTARADDELLVSITYRPPAGARIAVDEIMQRRGDFALSGVAICLGVESDTITLARIGWFGMGSTPMRATAAEAALTGSSIASLDPAEIATLAIGDSDPLDDSHGSAEYRRTVGHALFQRVLEKALNCRILA